MSVSYLGLEIKGFAAWLEQQPDNARNSLLRMDALFRAFARHRGGEIDHSDADAPDRWARFREPQQAFEAATLILEALAEQLSQLTPQPVIGMAVHSGEPSPLHNIPEEGIKERCAALLAAAHDWQVLLSEEAVRFTSDADRHFRPVVLGQHLLADLQPPMEVYRLGVSRGAEPADRILSLTTLPNNLPVQLTRFIGRKKELGEIQKILSHSRLVTLYGPGGCGKTRLALHVAARLLPQHSDGVWLIDLTSLRDGALIPQVVAETLPLGLDPSRPLLGTLLEQLQSKRLLLLLDNCEHLADACAAFINDLLRTCPYVRVLATSREVLHVPCETEWSVPPLSYPPARDRSSVEDLYRYDAIRLFLDRAHSRIPSWQLGTENAQLLAHLCRGLDGLPLAIELLVAALKIMTMDQIAHQLSNVLALLGNGYASATRHKSMRAALDWSHDLLGDSEKKLLRRLSVFVGGATLDAITAVCSGQGVIERRIPELLMFLSDKSLLDANHTEGEVRYSLKEVIRQYAAEKLQDADEEMQIHQRHRDWCLRFAQEADSNLTGPEESTWVQRVDKEYNNIRKALEWTKSTGDNVSLVSLTTALSNFWYQRGYLQEGRQWFQVALGLNQEPSSMRAGALRGIGRLAIVQDDYEAAISYLRESVDIYRKLDDPRGVGMVLNNLGAVAMRRGDYDAARTLLEEALDIQRVHGNSRQAANILNNLGGCAMGQGDFEQASTLLGEAIEIWRTLGDRFKIVDSLDNLGVIARVQGDLTKASRNLQEALDLRNEMGDTSGIPTTMIEIAQVLALQGRYPEARAIIEESVLLNRTVGNKLWGAISLIYLGIVYRLQGDLSAAEPLFQGSMAVLRELDERAQLGVCLCELGHLARYRREYSRAEELYRQSLAVFQEMRTNMGTAEVLNGLAALAGDQGEYQEALSLSQRSLSLLWGMKAYPLIAETLESMARAFRQVGSSDLAAQLMGCAEALRTSMGTPIPPALQSVIDEDYFELRSVMGAHAFEAARQAGAATRTEEIVRRALAEQTSTAHSHQSVIHAKLTPREMEVIRLVAKGLRDQDIAKELVISRRTVEVHLRNMLEKAGVANRAALVAWAVQQGNLFRAK